MQPDIEVDLSDQAPLRAWQLEAALREEPRHGADLKLSGKEEALLVPTPVQARPKLRPTLELLADGPVSARAVGRPAQIVSHAGRHEDDAPKFTAAECGT